MLIHAQRPEASACADYDVWTRRMGRYVRRGAKGIALVDNSGDAPRLRYVFDVSDTGARRNSRPFRPWTVNDGNLREVRLGLTQDFGAEGEWLSTQLQDAARELAEMYFDEHRYDIGAIVDGSLMAGYDEDELRASFIRAATASAAYALLARCGYDPAAYYEAEDFGFLSEWNTPKAAAALGGAVSEINQIVLREIERSIRSYERSRYNDRNNLHDRELGTASEPEPARDQPLGKYGRLRQKYLREHRPVLWNCLLLTGRLYEHLSEIEEAAQSRIDLMLPKLAEAAGATEALKAADPLKWTGLMNSCKAQAEEVVLDELIYN